MRDSVRFICTLLAACLLSAGIAAAQTPSIRDFNLPAQPLAVSLRDVGAQAHLNVFFDAPKVEGKIAPAIRMTGTTDQALVALLRPSGLKHRFLNENTVVLAPWNGEAKNSDAAQKTKTTMLTESATSFLSPSVGRGNSEDESSNADLDSPVKAGHQDEASGSKDLDLAEIVVTGSRLRSRGDPQPGVRVYTNQSIERSGRTTVSEFLNTLPNVSVSVHDSTGGFGGAGQPILVNTVKLHGLPNGTTLLLIDGRRVESSGLTGGGTGQVFFDLNNIPVAAIERVELLSEGSSAIYGSDAIAGVVNIVLKKDFSGLEIDGKYGYADGMDDFRTNVAIGHRSERVANSLFLSYQTNSLLGGDERSLTGNQDYTRFGGADARATACNPGNVYSLDGSPLPGASSSFAAYRGSANSGTAQLSDFSYDSLNHCSYGAYTTLVSPRDQLGALWNFKSALTDQSELFLDVLFSDSKTTGSFRGAPSGGFFLVFPISGANPYNPFGQDVNVEYLFTDASQASVSNKTNFIRPSIGLKGKVLEWDWQTVAWYSRDEANFQQPAALANVENILASASSTDPATAINPFVRGRPASQQILSGFFGDATGIGVGSTVALNSFVRGNLLELPSGSLEIVFGAELGRDRFFNRFIYRNAPSIPDAPDLNVSRRSKALFSEARLPLFKTSSSESLPARNIATLTAAVRYDHFNDFGSKTTPQFGLELRPASFLLLKGGYGRAFKAPSLPQLYTQIASVPSPIVDTQRDGQTVFPDVTFGSGNGSLRPETAVSRTLGILFSSPSAPSLSLSASYWNIDQSNSIQIPDPQSLVDNESSFRDRVVRAPPEASAPGPIVAIDASFINFGEIKVSGFDYDVRFGVTSRFGEFNASLSATNTHRYDFALAPGFPVQDAQSRAQESGNWSPAWKGGIGLTWSRSIYEVNIGSRYVGRYLDYDGRRSIGDFWLCDGSLRFAIGDLANGSNVLLRGGYLTLGGVNLLNKAPQFSSAGGGYIGYDPAQADVRRRFLYAQVGTRF